MPILDLKFPLKSLKIRGAEMKREIPREEEKRAWFKNSAKGVTQQ